MRWLAPAVMMACFAASPAAAQAEHDAVQRFDFAGATARGHLAVTPETAFSAERGYGYEPNAGAALFSVAAGPGDYRVRVTFGDARSASDTVVRAESRRLMLERVRTRRGMFATEEFIVNVRNAHLTPPDPNAPGGASVRLKPREIGSYTWDDKLTLEFSGPAPRIATVTIERVERPRIFLLGDSTVADQQVEPYASWGQMLTRFFGPEVSVANHAESGESLKSSLVSLRLDKVLSEMRPGDWALIQFGHNDQKEQWPQTYAAAETTYRDYLRVYIAEIRRRGGNPVLVTSVHRRTFDAQGRITNSLGGYPEAVRIVAAAEGVPVIDLNAMSATLYEALGPARAPLAFAQEGRDATHHNNYGAYELARCIVRAIREQGLPFARYLRTDTPLFDPAHPDAPETFALPDSVRREPAPPPAGN